MKPFVAIDFETANNLPYSACAVALVRFDASGNPTETLSTLLKPHPEADFFNDINIRIHKIHPEDVEDAPTWADIYPEVQRFIGSDMLVAHNVRFDRKVFESLNEAFGLPQISNDWDCSLVIARKFLQDIENHRLNTVFHHYFPSEGFNHHEAYADAIACGRIYTAMNREFLD
ncbi:MAG: exonuclease domain-containing protein [Corynebacterium sp.]|nr:exonuclease domain-containing protein [Corynebacterium sp.]